jgi:hypothetical protein
MTISSDVVKCTVHDGILWMHLDEKRLEIPSRLVNKSQLLTDMLSSVADASVTSDFTLAAPKEWLVAWTSCFCSGSGSRSDKKRLSCADVRDLVNCLLVCFCYRNTDPLCR